MLSGKIKLTATLVAFQKLPFLCICTQNKSKCKYLARAVEVRIKFSCRVCKTEMGDGRLLFSLQVFSESKVAEKKHIKQINMFASIKIIKKYCYKYI